MGTFQIYSYVANSLFRIRMCVFNQTRCISMVHQFELNTTRKYPKRKLAMQQKTMTPKREIFQRKSSTTRMEDRMNYYNTLGIDKTAGLEDIKRAYYVLARKFHPDSSIASTIPYSEKKFQQITEAYTVLSDENKRRHYELFGIVKNINKTLPKVKFMKPNEQNLYQVAEEIDYQDKSAILENPSKHANENTLKLTFMESIRGTTKDLTVNTMKQCPRCSGSNEVPFKKNLTVCDKCNGSGLQRIISSVGNIVRGVCKSCRGRRFVPQHTCSECGGRGIKIENERIEVNIPPGINSGDVMTIQPKKGQQTAIRLNVAKHEHFSRVGNDIYSDLPITLSQAVLGGVVTAKGIFDNQKVVLKPGTENGTKIRLIDKGVKSKSAVGDHFLRVFVRIPKMLTVKQKSLMAVFAETEVEGPDEKAEIRRSKIKEELANLHNLNQNIPLISRFPQKPSITMAFNQLTRNKSYSYRTL